MATMSRGTARNFAYNVGRQARIEGLALHDANVRLAYKLRWIRREQYDDALLDECERGWRAEDSLRAQHDPFDDDNSPEARSEN